MICQAIINDFEIGRRIIYVMDDSDFNSFYLNRDDGDDLLDALQHHDLFRGKQKWADLDIKHFHVMIVNMLKIIGGMNDDVRADKESAPVKRLVFFLCALITLVQEKTGSKIELFRINRVSDTDIVYDYSATLEVLIERPAPPSGLKIIVDNEE